MKRFEHKDLLGIGDLSVQDLEIIFETAESLKEISSREIKKVPTLRGKSVVNFFMNQAQEPGHLLKSRPKG